MSNPSDPVFLPTPYLPRSLGKINIHRLYAISNTDNNDRNAANYVGDTVQQGLSGASKEANKSVAKDSDASLGTRASAAKDAIGDKADETSSSASASVNKEAAKH
ncbi:Glucose-repressible protein [Xylographa carneopallida]|nr:Glucose-repressible protein [Xylographa carneopallida]